MLLLTLRLLGLESVVAGVTAGAGGGGAAADDVTVVSIFFSGEGSAEREGLFVFFVTVGLAVLVVVGLARASFLARALAVDEADDEDDQEEERDEDELDPERDREPLLELLAEELEYRERGRCYLTY